MKELASTYPGAAARPFPVWPAYRQIQHPRLQACIMQGFPEVPAADPLPVLSYRPHCEGLE